MRGVHADSSQLGALVDGLIEDSGAFAGSAERVIALVFSVAPFSWRAGVAALPAVAALLWPCLPESVASGQGLSAPFLDEQV